MRVVEGAFEKMSHDIIGRMGVKGESMGELVPPIKQIVGQIELEDIPIDRSFAISDLVEGRIEFGQIV